MAPEEIYHDAYLGIWLKPAGLMVEPDRFGHPNLQEMVGDAKHRPVWPVHRLDRPTSGLVLFAYKKSAVAPLMNLFAERTVQKSYTAWLERPWEEGNATWWDWGLKNNREFRMDIVPEGTPDAKSMGMVLQPGSPSDCVEIALLTGRYHQIRAQLAHRGYPVRGDVAYGAQPWEIPNAIGLHAGRLRLVHPWTLEECKVEVPPSWPLRS